MKNKIALTLMALGLALPVTNLNAQDADQSPRPPRHEREDFRGPRPGPGPRALFSAIDKNGDGVIDRREFADAIQALTRSEERHPRRFAEERRRGPRDDSEQMERPPHPPGMERPDAPERRFRDEDRPVPPHRIEREREENRGERVERGERMEGSGPRPGPRFERMEHRPHFAPPLLGALDTNHDGVIDANEIANAPESLKKLDRNGDGEITMREVRGAGGFGLMRREDRRESERHEAPAGRPDRQDGPRGGHSNGPEHSEHPQDGGE